MGAPIQGMSRQLQEITTADPLVTETRLAAMARRRQPHSRLSPCLRSDRAALYGLQVLPERLRSRIVSGGRAVSWRATADLAPACKARAAAPERPLPRPRRAVPASSARFAATAAHFRHLTAHCCRLLALYRDCRRDLDSELDPAVCLDPDNDDPRVLPYPDCLARP